jgi:hypothetical protein
MEALMDKRTTGIVLTVVSVLLCGCPGICLCLFGAVTATGVMPYETTFNDYVGTGTVPAWMGFVLLCLALIFIVIPIVVGYLTLGRKEKVEFDEPIPPAI